MSDLAATNCSNSCDCGFGECNNSYFWLLLLLFACGNNGCGGCNNSCGNGCDNLLWFILLLSVFGKDGCGGGCGCGC